MVITNFRYTMHHASGVAKKAAHDVEEWLQRKPETIEIINVEDDPAYRKRDIDLIYKYRKDGVEIATTIEIKGDRWYRTGNYFLETVSNDQKKTPGCFMYSEAEYLFYYFVEMRELHIMPMNKVREWFKTHIEEFDEKKTMTPLPNGRHYNTVGRLVPRKRLQDAVREVIVIRI